MDHAESAQKQALQRHLNNIKKGLRAEAREEEIQSAEFQLKLAKRQIAEATLRGLRQQSGMHDADAMSEDERDVKRQRTMVWRKSRTGVPDDDTDSVSSVSTSMSDEDSACSDGDSGDADTDDASDDRSSSSSSGSSGSDEEDEQIDDDDQQSDDDVTSSESEVEIIEIVRRGRYSRDIEPETSESSGSD